MPRAVPSRASSRSPRRPGYVTAGGALVIGLVAGGLCYSATLLQRAPGRRRPRCLRGPRRRRHVRRHRHRRLRVDRDQGRLLRPASTATRSRSSSRSSRSLRPSFAAVGTVVIVKVVDVVLGIRVSPKSRRWASTCPSTARPPTSPDAGAAAGWDRLLPGPTGRRLVVVAPFLSGGRCRSLSTAAAPSLRRCQHHGHRPARTQRSPSSSPGRGAAVRRALRARRLRRRVRRRRRWPVACPGPAAGPRRPRGAGPSRCIRSRWRVQRRRRHLAAAGSPRSWPSAGDAGRVAPGIVMAFLPRGRTARADRPSR